MYSSFRSEFKGKNYGCTSARANISTCNQIKTCPASDPSKLFNVENRQTRIKTNADNNLRKTCHDCIRYRSTTAAIEFNFGQNCFKSHNGAIPFSAALNQNPMSRLKRNVEIGICETTSKLNPTLNDIYLPKKVQ